MHAWLRLSRIALAPTIVWDVVAGALLMGALPVDLWRTLVPLLLVFHAGMILNDWVDRGLDQRAGRLRPLVCGTVSARAALLVAMWMILLALLMAWQWLPGSLSAFVFLSALVLLYDFGGLLVRPTLGPVILALCRATSLALGMAAVVPLDQAMGRGGTWAAVSYALYVLFLSRMATREEAGGPGMRLLPYVIAACLAPLPLSRLDAGSSLWWIPYWLLLAAWLLPPALRDRHQVWEPQRVQQAVRRALQALPLLPAMALVAHGMGWYYGLVGIGVSALVGRLARALPPE